MTRPSESDSFEFNFSKVKRLVVRMRRMTHDNGTQVALHWPVQWSILLLLLFFIHRVICCSAAAAAKDGDHLISYVKHIFTSHTCHSFRHVIGGLCDVIRQAANHHRSTRVIIITVPLGINLWRGRG